MDMMHVDPAKTYQKGVDALKAGDFKSADADFDQVLEFAPREINTLNLSGVAKARLGNFKGARDAYKKALAVNANFIPARQGYALALIALGDRDGATKESDTLKDRAATCANACPDAAALVAAITAIDGTLNASAKTP